MIEKKSASELFVMGAAYTTLPNKSMDLFSEFPLAMGVWAGIIRMHSNWNVNQKDICTRFSISKSNYYKIVSFLKEVDLMREYTKRSRAKLMGKVTVVVSGVFDWVDAEKILDANGKEGKYYLTRPSCNYKLGHIDSPVYPNGTKGSCELPVFGSSQNTAGCGFPKTCTSTNVAVHDCGSSQIQRHININIKKIKQERNKKAKQYPSNYQGGEAHGQQKTIESAAAFSSERRHAVKASGENMPNVTAQNNAQAPHGEVMQETKLEPSAKPTIRTSHSQRPVNPVEQKPSNTKPSRSNGVAEPVIGDKLTEKQRFYVAKMVKMFASRNAGLTVEKLEAEILNLSAFPQCGKDFVHKANSIRIQLSKGAWTPRKVQRPPANRNQWSPDAVAEKRATTVDAKDSGNLAVSVQRYRESREGRIDMLTLEIAAIKATFTDTKAKYRGELFFTAQREKIAKLEEKLRQLGAGTPDVADFPVSIGFSPYQQHAAGG